MGWGSKFKKAVKKTKKVIKKINKPIKKVTKSVSKPVKKAAKKTLPKAVVKASSKAVSDTKKTVNKAVRDTEKEGSRFVKSAGTALGKAGTDIWKTVEKAGQDVRGLMNPVGDYLWDEGMDKVSEVGESWGNTLTGGPKGIDTTYAGDAYAERTAKGLLATDDTPTGLKGLKIKRKDKDSASTSQRLSTGR